MSNPEDNSIINFIEPDQLNRDLAIDPTDLTGCMQRHSQLQFDYGAKSSRARRQTDRWKTLHEIIEAQLDAEHRSALTDAAILAAGSDPKNKPKLPTEAQIRAKVLTDPRWRMASKKVADAEEQFRMAAAAEYAFRDRKDLLLQIARDASREQHAGPLRVLANQDAAAARDTLLSKIPPPRNVV